MRLKRLAVFQVVEHLDDQLAAVADVLNRVREVVHEADRDAAEHRLPFLLPDVFLQLDEPVGHVVEREAELAELVARVDLHALVELALGQRPGAARQRENRIDEAVAPEVPDAKHGQQRDGDGDAQLPLQADWDRERLGARLLDDDRPAERLAAAPPRPASARARRRTASEAICSSGARRSMRATSGCAAHVVAARDARFRVRVAVREQLAFVGDDERVAVLADANAVDHPPHLFEVQPADEPAAAVAVHEPNRDDRRRQQVVVDREARHQRAVDVRRLPSPGRVDGGRAERLDTIGCPLSSSSVSSLNSGN